MSLAASLLVPLASLHAVIVSLPNDDGFKVFEDQNTGLEWLGLNNFFDETPNQEFAAASAAGFTWATLSDVQTLLNGLPLGSGQWPSYAAIMGSAPNRALIWGDYFDPNYPNLQMWAWSYDYDSAWSIPDLGGSSGLTNDQVPNGGGSDADLNLWAFKEIGKANVPDSGSTLILLGISVLGLAIASKRKSLRQAGSC